MACGQPCNTTDDATQQMTRGPVRRTRQGDFELKLSEHERQLLGDLVGQLTSVLGDDYQPSENPILRRLFPVAHPDDHDLEASYQELVGNDLVSLRREKLLVVAATLNENKVDEQTLLAWLNVINDLRLVLGTHLDVSEDDDHDLLDPNNPDADTYAIYGYLGYLLDSIIESLA